MSNTRFYRIWTDMKTRCLNSNYRFYKDYGGRGIKICTKWLSFDGFKEDLYKGYFFHCKNHGENDTFIERTDNNGDYELKNVVWATRKEQNGNKRMFKLTREKVSEIREKYKYGKGRLLAKEYNVSPAVISEVVNFKRNYGNY